MKRDQIAKYIDHTLLKQEATIKDIEKLCEEAAKYNFASVCINPCYVKEASEILTREKIKVCTVIGFPLGANTSETKIFEAVNAVKNGADEIDMVMNIGKFKAEEFDYVENEIKAIKNSIGEKTLKVIIETCLLEKTEIETACEIIMKSKADYVKTSTGFSKAGAEVEQIKFIKKIVGESIGIKASGGIRTYDSAISMINAGATRIGTSASIDIWNGAKN